MELYRISFPPHISMKVYIGITSKTAEERFKEHCSSKKDYPIVRALRKYGCKNAALEVLAYFDSFDELYAAEQQAIKDNNSKAPLGYNLTDGGKGTFGLPASDERKRKISIAHKGRKASEETRRKIGEANKGRDFSVQVAAMAKATRGVKKSPETIERMRKVWIGRKHSEESKRKMSQSASKRKASDETRKAMSIAMKAKRGKGDYHFLSPEGVAVCVSNMREFCLENGLTKPQMYCVASGVAKSHKGWRRV